MASANLVHVRYKIILCVHGQGDFAEDSDLAELGIGGLAHIDLSIGRRSSCSHKEKIRSSLDRTSTPPSLPSQTSKTEYEESLWDLPSFQQEEQGNSLTPTKTSPSRTKPGVHVWADSK